MQAATSLQLINCATAVSHLNKPPLRLDRIHSMYNIYFLIWRKLKCTAVHLVLIHKLYRKQSNILSGRHINNMITVSSD